MPSFESFPSATARMSLDQVINALVENPRVECCFLLGSTATGIARWSDYDVLVVGDVPEPFAVEFSFIDSRATDVILVSGNEFRRVLSQSSAASSQDCDLLSWIAASKVAFSKDPSLQSAPRQAHAVLLSGSVLRGETYMRWVEANHLLLKIRRYQTAGSEDYRDGLALLLAKSIAALPQDFLCARGVRWLGDKDGMKAVRKLDEQFAAEVLEALQTTNLNEKCAAYAKLLQQSYAPVAPMWKPSETAGGWFKPDGAPRDRSAWESLHVA
jgi:hypothetical protein